MKEVNDNLIKEENIEDILLIVTINAQDYTNYFHLENIERISKYLNKFYTNIYSDKRYEGIGKIFNEYGSYYIGKIKNNLPNGKGNIFDKNGNLRYEGDFIDGNFEDNGKLIDDGIYYLGQFKNNLPNGKGILNIKNGFIIYEGYFIEGNMGDNGKFT